LEVRKKSKNKHFTRERAKEENGKIHRATHRNRKIAFLVSVSHVLPENLNGNRARDTLEIGEKKVKLQKKAKRRKQNGRKGF